MLARLGLRCARSCRWRTSSKRTFSPPSAWARSVAEFERDLLVERTQSGLAQPKAQGKASGRPSKLTSNQIADIRQKRLEDISLSTLASEYGVSRSAHPTRREACRIDRLTSPVLGTPRPLAAKRLWFARETSWGGATRAMR